MATKKTKPPMAPSPSVEGRINQIVALAFDEAERRILDGTASSQLLTEFIKMGTPKAQIENANLAKQSTLLDAKTENIKQTSNQAQMYKEAMDAFKKYSGHKRDIEDI